MAGQEHRASPDTRARPAHQVTRVRLELLVGPVLQV